MRPIKLATVFSGIGAIEWAFERLSLPYEIVFACDNGEREIKYDLENTKKDISTLESLDCVADYQRALYGKHTRKKNWVEEIYFHNYGRRIKPERFYQDILLLDGKPFKGQIDLLMGGSPCQSFSVVGKQLGFEDTRGTLFYEFARIVKETEPNVFIYENVRGLTTHDKKKTFETILHVLQDEFDYNVTWDVFNATEFNIPQIRSRVLIVGTKKNCGFDVKSIRKKGLTRTMQDFLEDNCADGHFTSLGNGEISIEPIPGSPDPKSILSPAVTKYVTKSGTKNWHMKPAMDRPIARTLLKTMANHHRAGVDNYVTIDSEHNIFRALTPRECFRLMGFTDEFKLTGIPWSHLYMQAGNSIVVDMLISVLQRLLETKAFG